MATKDYQAKQVRLQRLITSGGIAAETGDAKHSRLGLLVYSSSVATNFIGGVDARQGTGTSALNLAGMLANVGSDVSIFVSGSATRDGQNPGERSDVMLYGGDLVVSGTLWAERVVVEVTDETGGDLLLSGTLHVKPDSTHRSHHQFWVENGTTGGDSGDATLIVADALDSKVGIKVAHPQYDLHIASASNTPGDHGPGPVAGLSRWTNSVSGIHEHDALGSIVFAGGGTSLPGSLPGPTYYSGSVISTHADAGGGNASGTRPWALGSPYKLGSRVVISIQSGSQTTTPKPVEAFRVDSNRNVSIGVHQDAASGSREEQVSKLWVMNQSTEPTKGLQVEQKNPNVTAVKITTQGTRDHGVYIEGHQSSARNNGKALLNVEDPSTYGTNAGGPTVRINQAGAADILHLAEDGTTRIRVIPAAGRGNVGADASAFPSLQISGAIFHKGSGQEDRVFFLSGSNVGTKPGNTKNETFFKDVNFFVSGSKGYRGGQEFGVALFGGDLHISGNISLEPGSVASGFGWVDDGGVVRLETAADSVGIGTSAPQSKLHLKDAANDPAIFIETPIGSESSTSSSIAFTTDDGTMGALVRGSSAEGYQLTLVSSASNRPIALKVPADFPGGVTKFYDAVKVIAHVSNGGGGGYDNPGRVLINSGSRPSATPGLEANLSAVGSAQTHLDTTFFVSGAIGSRLSRDTNLAGTSVFGGDLHVSGNFSLDGTQPFGWKRVNEAGVIDTSDGGKLVRLVEPDDKVGIGTTSAEGHMAKLHVYSGSGILSPAGILVHGSHVSSTSISFINSAAANPLTDAALVSEGLSSPTPGAFVLVNSQSARAVALKGIHVNGAGNDKSSAGLVFFPGDISSTAPPRVILLSGSRDTVTPGLEFNIKDPLVMTDTSFFVSGAIGGKDSTHLVAGTSVFGGDLVVSGGLHVDGTTLVVDQANNRVGIGTDTPETVLHLKSTSPSKPVLKIENQQGGSNPVAIQLLRNTTSPADDDFIGDIHFRSMNNAGTPEEVLYAYITALSTDITDGSEDGEIQFHTMKSGVVTNTLTLQSGFAGFGTSTPAAKIDVRGDGSSAQVLLLSGAGGTKSPDETTYTDLAFFVSGTMGAMGSTTKGTSVFGGDMVVSGGLMVGAPATQTADGSTQNFTVNSKNIPGIIHVNGANDTVQFATEGTAGPVQMGADTFFHVSGSIGGDSIAVFGGDVVISGSLSGGSPVSLGDGAEISGSLYLALQADPHAAQGGNQEVAIYARNPGTGIKLYQNIGGTETELGGAILVSSGSTEYTGVTQLSLGNMATVTNEGDGVLSLTGSIGTPEDGSYADGLFTSFTGKTTIGTMVDKFNEVLKALAPAPAPDADDVDGYGSSTGTLVYITFGDSNSISGITNEGSSSPVVTVGGLTAVDALGIYTTATGSSVSNPANRLGAWGGSGGAIDIYGNINADVPKNDSGTNLNYTSGSFGDADQGEPQLWLNGTQVTLNGKSGSPTAVDLTGGITAGAGEPGQGTDSTFINSNGTGFYNLSAAKSATAENGSTLAAFKHRTGRIKIDAADQRAGSNYFLVRHVIAGVAKTTNFVAWLVDENNDAIQLATTDTWAWGKSGLATVDISGVTYYSALGSTLGVGASVANAYKYTYDLNAITFSPTAGVGAIANAEVDNVSFAISNQSKIAPGTAPYWNNSVAIARTSASGISLSANYILGGSLSTQFTVTHPLKNNATLGGTAALTGLLYYSLSDSSTTTTENFSGEGRRLMSSSFANSGEIASMGWTSSIELNTAAGYGAGGDNAQASIVYAKTLRSPLAALQGGDFRNTSDNGSSGIAHGPDSNPNYSSASGLTVYYRKFVADAACHGFKYTVSGSGTLVSADDALAAANDVRIFFKVPNNGSIQTGWLDAAELFSWHNTGDATSGDRSGGAAVSIDTSIGAALSTNYITFGTGSLAVSGQVVMKVEHNSGWNGELAEVALTFTDSGGTGTSPSMPPDTNGSTGKLETDSSVANNANDANLSFGSSYSISGYDNVLGTAGYGSAVNVNSEYAAATAGDNDVRLGAYGATDITGEVNGNVAAISGVYVADAFGNALKLDSEAANALILEINGAEYHTMNLTTAVGSGAPGSGTADSLTGDSGFRYVSVAAPATYGTNSVPDYSKMYRTAGFKVATGQQRSGWNYVRVIHRRSGVSDVITNYIEWVNDATGAALALSESGAAIANFITGGGGTYSLSGVTYFNAPTGVYSVTCANVYRNVYSSAAQAIITNHTNSTITNITTNGTGITNTSIDGDSSIALPSLDTTVSNCEQQDITINATVRGTASKVLPGTTYGSSSTTAIGISSVTVKAPLKSNLSTTGATKTDFLIWSGNSESTSNEYTDEHYVNESYRVQSGSYTAQAAIGSGAWVSTVSMNDVAGNQTYSDGMIIYNSYLFSPKGPSGNYGGGFAGDFRRAADGGTLQAPSGNPNYSSLSVSQRTYYRYFENNTSSDVAQVQVTIKGDATIIQRGTGTSLGANKNIYVDIKIPGKLPSQDTAGSSNFAGFQDMARPSASSARDYAGMFTGTLDTAVDGSGATNTVSFNGQTLNGTTSGAEKMIIRITASENWTGYITEINVSY